MAVSHSIRNTCSDPTYWEPRATSTTVPPAFRVRAIRVPVAWFVPNIAHDSVAPPSVSAKPAFWYAAPLNVAENSTARPEPPDVPARSQEPSTDAVPPGNVVVPPVQAPTVQPEGTPVPSNSAPTSGASMTSPPAEFDT